MAQIMELPDKVTLQNDQIENIRNSSPVEQIPDTNGNYRESPHVYGRLAMESHDNKPRNTEYDPTGFKAPLPSVFYGKSSERNFVSVRSFFYRLQNSEIFGNMSEEKKLSLAFCHLEGKQASWIMRLELIDKKPTSLQGLRLPFLWGMFL